MMDRLCPLLLFALGLLSAPPLSPPPPFVSEPRPPLDVSEPPPEDTLLFPVSAAEEAPPTSDPLLPPATLPIKSATHRCASSALCSSESLLSSWCEGMVIPRSNRCWSSLF